MILCYLYANYVACRYYLSMYEYMYVGIISICMNSYMYVHIISLCNESMFAHIQDEGQTSANKQDPCKQIWSQIIFKKWQMMILINLRCVNDSCSFQCLHSVTIPQYFCSNPVHHTWRCWSRHCLRLTRQSASTSTSLELCCFLNKFWSWNYSLCFLCH